MVVIFRVALPRHVASIHAMGRWPGLETFQKGVGLGRISLGRGQDGVHTSMGILRTGDGREIEAGKSNTKGRSGGAFMRKKKTTSDGEAMERKQGMVSAAEARVPWIGAVQEHAYVRLGIRGEAAVAPFRACYAQEGLGYAD